MGAQLQFEHFAVNVEDPVPMAEWYCAHLGMKVVRRGETPDLMHFLADATGQVIMEIYRALPDEVPDYASMNPLILHLALATDDAQGTHDRLVAAGATALAGVTTNDAGDCLAMLRDPWGLSIQLCQRAQPMV